MSEHTKGSWVFDRKHGNIYSEDLEMSICNLCSVSGDELMANGQIISAAPDMFEALELAREFIKNGLDYKYTKESVTPHSVCELQLKIEAAIKKAKGGNS